MPPPPALAERVACAWTRGVVGGESAATRVMPDGCVDLVWSVTPDVGAGTLFVAGPDTGPVLNVLPPGARVIGVRLRPGAAPPLLAAPADELRDARVPLETLWGGAATLLAEQLAEAPDDAARLALLLDAVAARSAAAAPDPLVRPLLAALADGDDAFAALTRALGVSERQARRRFSAAIGYGPRSYRRVARFQRFLALARRRGSVASGLARLAADAGYADQAHLTREVVRLAGTTPGALLADGA